MAVNVEALANQAAAQGQSMLNQDNTNAAQYKASGDTYQQQADAANKQVGDYTNYMANEGSAGNQYHNELGSQLNTLGYDPAQMTAARNNLNQATGALSAYSDFANTAASKWGQNAGGFAAANSGALAGLNNNIASNQNVANGLQSLYTTAQTGANQFAGQQVEGEKNTLAGYQQQYTNASNSRDAAYTQMNFWADLAVKQGGLNADQQNAYAQARASYSASQASLASAQYAISQAKNMDQQTAFNQETHDKKAAADAAAKTAQQQKQQQAAAQQAASHNNVYNLNTTNLGTTIGSGAKDVANAAQGLTSWITGRNQGYYQNS